MVPDAENCKTDKKALAEEDRISNLPVHLINCILDCMLINDAARTSVLSKTWRHIWQTYPHLDIGLPFTEKLLHNIHKQVHRSIFTGVICMIFFAHRGPILKFTLYLPPELRIYETSFTHLWMNQVSDRGVKILRLINAEQNHTNIVPSHLFSCSALTELLLSNWKLNPPLHFRGYNNLSVVYLQCVILTGDMSFGAQIKEFSLIQCAGIQHLETQFKYHSQNLYKLHMHRSEQLENLYVLDPHRMKKTNIYKLLDNMPNVADLQLNGVCLQFLDPGLAFYKRLTKSMGNLKSLGFIGLKFYDLLQISNAFSLIRSSPNLQILFISVTPEATSRNPINRRFEQYLESLDCMNIILDQLQAVKICDVMGSRAELLFIKLLLTKSPLLKSMTLYPSSKFNDPKEEVRILRTLLQFSRSSSVQIFWKALTDP